MDVASISSKERSSVVSRPEAKASDAVVDAGPASPGDVQSAAGHRKKHRAAYEKTLWKKAKRAEKVGRRNGTMESQDLAAWRRERRGMASQSFDESNGIINWLFDSQSEPGLAVIMERGGSGAASSSDRNNIPNASGAAKPERLEYLNKTGHDTANSLSSLDNESLQFTVDGNGVDYDHAGDSEKNNAARYGSAEAKIRGEGQGGSGSGGENGFSSGCDITPDMCLTVPVIMVDRSPSPGADSQMLLLEDTGGESSLRIIGEIILPFILAGFGCVFAGLVLGIVQVHLYI